VQRVPDIAVSSAKGEVFGGSAGRSFPGGLFVLICLLGGVFFAASAGAAERQVLSGHVVRAVAALQLQPVGKLPDSQNLQLAIGLPLRDRETVTNLLQRLYDPTDPQYHRWLRPEEFAARFGPTEKDYQAVIEFATTNGLTVIGTHPNRTLVDVRGSVADIERTFGVKLLVYQHPTQARQFYAPDREPSVALAAPLLAISGLDDYVLNRPGGGAGPFGGGAPGSGSGPFGAYRGNDFRAAYAPGTTLNGTNQAVGLFELDGYYPGDITAYENEAGLPNTVLTNVLVDGYSGSAGDANLEVALDIDMAQCMAPALSGIIVYESTNLSVAVNNDVLNRMATDDLAAQLSCSWLINRNASTEQIFQQFAMQGQSFFQCAGDDGAYNWSVSGQQREDSPSVTIVGGTILTMSGAGAAWSSETTWPFSGGGVSATYPIPVWQQGVNMTTNGGSPFQRNIPDVAMVATNITLIWNNGFHGVAWGTSAAAPLWAGLTALVNQQAAANGGRPVGFINPAIYGIGTGAAYAVCFHDITTGNNENANSPSQYSAVPGYDLCTGWGTPAGSNLVNALAPLPQPDLTAAAASLDDTRPRQGASITATITITNRACAGGSAAAGAFHVGFYSSVTPDFAGTMAFYEAPVAGCPADGSVTFTQSVMIVSSTSPGDYYLGFKINDENEVAECDTNNNFFDWKIAVLPACTYRLSATAIAVPAKGGPKTVQVTTQSPGCSWTARSNDPFITITSGGSSPGSGTVHFLVAGNTNAADRAGTLTVAGQMVTVNQAGGGCAVALSPVSAKFKASGGTGTVKVTPGLTNCDWSAASNNGFITLTTSASGTGKGSIGYSVAGNATTVAQSGSITIGGETFTIDEAGVPCEISLGQASAVFGSAGGSSNVTVTANGTNCEWKAVVSGPFIHITSGDSGAGSGQIDYTVEPNTKTSPQTGAITVGKEKLAITESPAP